MCYVDFIVFRHLRGKKEHRFLTYETAEVLFNQITIYIYFEILSLIKYVTK